jgi:hypothetical protein
MQTKAKKNTFIQRNKLKNILKIFHVQAAVVIVA